MRSHCTYLLTISCCVLLLALASITIKVQANKTDAKEPDFLSWSRQPPGGLNPKNIPQFVSITFDDNFGLANPAAVGGMNYIIDFYKNKKNPAGTGNPKNFDGSPIKTSFYHTSIYIVDEKQIVLGGKSGEDHLGRNRKAWSAAFQFGHEAAVHTVNHFNGGVVPLDLDDCCRARNWKVEEWEAEIKSCKDTLTGAEGIGAKPNDVIGFRAPFLGYNDNVFSALRNLKFTYDTTLPNCFDDAENGKNCSWPYTLNEGSPDADVLARKFPTFKFPKVTSHPGLWEIPPTALVVPPDTLSSHYRFTPGLRARIAKRGPLPYPSVYERSTGKIAGLDYTLLMDAGLTGAEMSAVLKYNLDLHIAGNRSPLVFIAHSHLYTYSTPEDNPDTPTAAERDARWKGLTDFILYALAKPEVRIVSAKDLLEWIQIAAGQVSARPDVTLK
jgi:peptidoglycan/xylan/chitin deacetylase (PgdA/CDA1 family)